MSEKSDRPSVAVLMGGPSSEREVSLRSGRAVAQALAGAGYAVRDIVIDDTRIPAPALECDLVFPALHGRFGEDGGVQQLLDAAGMPYVGSDARSSAAAFDKEATKLLLAECRIPTARWCILNRGDGADAIPFSPPLVIKPTREGSSIGITVVDRRGQLESALESAFEHGPRVLAERWLAGRELTVGIVNGRALPVIRIVPPGRMFDYDSKYTKGRTRYLCPAPLAPAEAEAAQAAALATWQVLRCRDLGRVDIILTTDGRPCVLEMNTIPGFTETSLLPMAAAEAGIPFADLCAALVQRAWQRERRRVPEES